MRDCGAPIAPARYSKMHIELSKNTATRKTKNGIEGIVSIKRIEDQPTSGGFGWSLAEENPYSIGAPPRLLATGEAKPILFTKLDSAQKRGNPLTTL